ncbi:MAG: dTMP kinase [Clostridia bacterium]|nr:dTMP kinase [Clostridia bacterium]
MRGKFVTIEGCEGVGKSTLINKLKEYFKEKGIDAVFTREPGGTVISEKLRDIILDPSNTEMDSLTELLLYAAARRQHTAEFIDRALDEGKIVFCDRYIDSTTVYQGNARGLSIDTIDMLNALCMGNTVIDATVFLDLDPEKGFARKGGSDGNRIENETLEFHKKVYRGYKKLQSKESRFMRIDASEDAESVFNEVIAGLKKRGII